MFKLIQAAGQSGIPNSAPGWVKSLVGAAGGWGLLVIAFFDSSFGTLPILNDLLVIWFSIQNPHKMVFYASMASIGSILGCLTLYYMARKGGEVVLRKKASPERIERIRRWYEKNEFLTVAIPAVLPPPTPFKVFIIAAGVFQVRLSYFITALAVGRGVRYFLWGILAVTYGDRTVQFLRTNYLQVSGATAAVMLLAYLAVRLVQRYLESRHAPPHQP